MDSYEGNNEDPLSLHKYLYAENDSVNKNDPSGNNSGYVEWVQVPAISEIIDLGFLGQAILGITAAYLFARIYTKRWSLYASIRPEYPEYHNAIFAIDNTTGTKWAYDVGVIGGWATYRREVVPNPFKFYPGFIIKNRREPDREYLFPIPVGKMNDSQLMLWETFIMGSSNGADMPNEAPFFYSFARSNCATFTLTAAEIAIIVSLNPL